MSSPNTAAEILAGSLLHKLTYAVRGSVIARRYSAEIAWVRPCGTTLQIGVRLNATPERPLQSTSFQQIRDVVEGVVSRGGDGLAYAGAFTDIDVQPFVRRES